MRSGLRIVGAAGALLVLIYFVWSAKSAVDWKDLRSIWTPTVMAAVGLAAVLYSLIIPISGVAWSAILRDMGVQWAASTSIGVMGATQLAKYLPGNVAQHIGRIGMAMSLGMRAPHVAASVIIETALAIAAALLVAMLALPVLVSQAEMVDSLSPALYFALLGLAVLGVAVWMLYCGVDLLQTRFPRIKAWFSVELRPVRWVTVIKVVLAYCLNYSLIGLGFWILLRSIAPTAEIEIGFVAGVFAMAWLAGFVAPGVPAGLGVREGVMLILLASSLPSHLAVLGILVMRVATILGDLLCFLLGVVLIKGAWRDSDEP